MKIYLNIYFSCFTEAGFSLV